MSAPQPLPQEDSPLCRRGKVLALVLFLALQGVYIGILVLPGKKNSTRHNSRNLQVLQQQDRHNKPMNQLPIILMGLPESGSLALHQLFECHGLHSRHYCCGRDALQVQFPCESTAEPTKANSITTEPSHTLCGECVLDNMKQSLRNPFEECTLSEVQVWASFDMETRSEWFLPQHFAIGLLHRAFPNATWILNQRSSSSDWAESILRWHSKTKRFLSSYKLPLYPHPISDPPDATTSAEVTTVQILQDMERSLTERVYNHTDHLRKQSLLQDIYDNHIRTVRRWGHHYPSHHLIEFDVDTDDPHVVLKDLLSSFGSNNDGANCGWNFLIPNKEWKNFDLPFATE